ncbi:VanZ family protein [Enterococcus saccharolyticus]|uniref:VanZ family protein n=1 Tax=Enterococcus saccharolyticus TaxID=41997 RepID=UPI001E5E242D|nr:VanZ family protein [Enterococcus saccharolyticus]MCD5001951.1 VanZ family protein [Enterococcus saccharolyticus]
MLKKNRKNGNLYLWIGLIMMGILFYSSSQTYEQQSQIGLLSKMLKNEPLKAWFTNVSFMYGGSEVSLEAKGYFSFVEFFIRKLAHFSTYFILGGSFFLGLFPKVNSLIVTAFFGWLAATGYAGIDEFHQMMTSGRTPLFQDVMLDSAGALTAVLLCWMLLGIKRKRWL